MNTTMTTELELWRDAIGKHFMRYQLLKRPPLQPRYVAEEHYPCCVDCDFMCAGNHRIPCRCQA